MNSEFEVYCLVCHKSGPFAPMAKSHGWEHSEKGWTCPDCRQEAMNKRRGVFSMQVAVTCGACGTVMPLSVGSVNTGVFTDKKLLAIQAKEQGWHYSERDGWFCPNCAAARKTSPLAYVPEPKSFMHTKRIRRNVYDELIRGFLAAGCAHHSSRAEMLLYEIDYCEKNKLPYVLHAEPGMGYFLQLKGEGHGRTDQTEAATAAREV